MNKIILLLLASLSLTLNLDPTVNIELKSSTFTPIINYEIPTMKSAIMGTAIPDIHDKASVYTLDLTNLKVTDVIINKGDINLQFMNGQLGLVINNVGINIQGDSHIVAVWIIDAKGQITVKVSNIAVDIELTPTFNNGRIQFSASKISVNAGNIDISITGNIGAKILNLFTSFIVSTVQDIIKQTAEDEVKNTVIPMINNELAILPYDYVCPDTRFPFAVHVEPKSDVEALQGQAHLNLTAYLHKNDDKELPNIDDPLPLYYEVPTSSYLRVYLSDYIVNSFIYAYQKIGYIWTINQQLIDQLHVKELDGILNTDQIDKIIPGFSNQFGANKKVQLEFSTPEAPIFQTTLDGNEVTLNLNLGLQIEQEDSQFETKVKLNGIFSIGLRVGSDFSDPSHPSILYSIYKFECIQAESDVKLVDDLSTFISNYMTQLRDFLYTNYPSFPYPDIPYVIPSNTYVSYLNRITVIDTSYIPRTTGLSYSFNQFVSKIIQKCFDKQNIRNKLQPFIQKNMAKLIFKYQQYKAKFNQQ